MAKATIRDVDLKGKRCFVRVDYNVPMKGTQITDETRIRASLPTVNYLVEQGAKVILASHLGRPKGKVVEDLRMDPVAKRLGELLGRDVMKADECVGDEVQRLVDDMKDGDVLLLENLRFYPGEEKNDPAFAKGLADLAEIFVNDAFGAAHRAHASTAGVADYIPAYAGFLISKEIEALGGLLESPERPFVAIIGGAKVSDKLSVLENLLEKVDSLLIGGGMANTFLLAQGFAVGKSLVEPGKVEDAKKIMAKAESLGKEILLPEDLVVAEEAATGAAVKVVGKDEIPSDEMALDIGPLTRKAFAEKLRGAKTVFWNGPVGVFEIEQFRGGTMELAAAMAEVQGFTAVGGGDILSAMEMSGLKDKIGHLSTGGGASLELIEGRVLPGIACIKDK